VGPHTLPELRTILSRVSAAEAESLAAEVMAMAQSDEIDRLLEATAERLLPREEFGD